MAAQPLITDDPDTPGPGYWEINLAAIIERSHLERRTEGPLADINYGVGQRIQLKFEFPWLSVHETGKPAESGPGNSLFGVKWRFLGREGKRVAWATYPQWEFNTSSSMADKGIVNEGWSFLLPTELTIQIGRVEFSLKKAAMDGSPASRPKSSSLEVLKCWGNCMPSGSGRNQANSSSMSVFESQSHRK